MELRTKHKSKHIYIRIYQKELYDDEFETHCEFDLLTDNIEKISNIIHSFLVDESTIQPKPEYYIISSSNLNTKKKVIERLKTLHLQYKNRPKLEVLKPNGEKNDL